MNLFSSKSNREAQAKAFTTSDGLTIPYTTRGKGEVLILLHGWSQSASMFRHQLEELSNSFQVVIPDIRGHGGAVTEKGLRMARLAADLAELTEHLGAKKVSVLGWSMGVSIVWAYVDLFGTDRLNRIILVDQPAMLTKLPGMEEDEIVQCGALFTLAELDALYADIISAEGETARSAFVAGMVSPVCTAEMLDWLNSECAKTPLNVAADLLWTHCSQDWRDVLGRIDRPTLVICGDVSHVDKRSQYYVHEQIKGSKIREFSAEECGAHFMFLEKPEVFNAVVSKFLSN